MELWRSDSESDHRADCTEFPAYSDTGYSDTPVTVIVLALIP